MEQRAEGQRGDLGRLFSIKGTHAGRPSIGRPLQRAITRPGALAIVLYRFSHRPGREKSQLRRRVEELEAQVAELQRRSGE